MKRFFFALALVLSFTLAFAQGDGAARKSLDKVVSKMALAKGATANFTMTGDKMNTSGSISIKGNKFCAKTGGATVWYDGKTQWMYNKKTNEVNVSTPTASQQQSLNPYTYVTLYKKGYAITKSNIASGIQYHLVGKGNISEVYILTDANQTIKQMKVKRNNKWVTINVSNFRHASLADGEFQFNKKDYPSAEVIDLR